MTQKLIPPPLQTPLVDQNGVMTKPWLDFLTDLAEAVEEQRAVTDNLKDRVEVLEA